MNTIAPETFKTCFTQCVEAMRDADPEVIAIDGKTARRTHDSARGRRPLHLVSAWARRPWRKNPTRSPPSPFLLERLVLTGALVTIDAMGTQEKIAETIVRKGADYLLALKGNRPVLGEDVARFFENPPKDMVETFETTDADHGRIENRHHLVCHDVSWLFLIDVTPMSCAFPTSPPSPWSKAASSATARPPPNDASISRQPSSMPVRSPAPYAPIGASRTACTGCSASSTTTTSSVSEPDMDTKKMAMSIARVPNDKHSLSVFPESPYGHQGRCSFWGPAPHILRSSKLSGRALKVRRNLAALDSDYLAALIRHAPQSF